MQFGDGATVTRISFPSDFSAVRISNLPAGSSKASVVAILAEVGLAVPLDGVWFIRQADQDSCTAIVKVEDAKFSELACRNIGTYVRRKLEAVSIPVPVPRGSTFHEFDCRQVSCSWHRPTREALLVFEKMHVAARVHKMLRDGRYKVLGTKVTAMPPIAQEGGLDEPMWTVKLKGLAETVKNQDITQGFLATDQPCRTEVGELSYDADMVMDCTLVMSMLYAFGPLEHWNPPDTTEGMGKGKLFRARAAFVDEAHARKAVAALNTKALPFCDTGKLFVQLVTSARFRVSTQVYDAVRGRINKCKTDWKRKCIRFFDSDLRGHYRILKLEGEDRKRVAKAQGDLERIVNGQVMMVDGKKIWYAGSMVNKGTYRKLKRIEARLGVVIIRDVRSSQFRVFGPEEKFAEAAAALHSLVQDTTAAPVHRLEMTQSYQLDWVAHGGVEALRAELGTDKVAFDMTAEVLAISGSERDVAVAKAMITRGQTEPTRRKLGFRPESLPECPVCYCEVENPVRTPCGHVYCGLCFTNLCQAQSTSPKAFAIACIGGSDRCRQNIALPKMQELVLSETFEDVLAASFASYVRQHPHRFRSCPTPDCSQCYRVASDATIPPTFTCAKCFVSTCTACHASHAGKTCAEHRGDASGGLAELIRIKEELGVKDCPKCTTSIERTEGCNHMTCSGCGAHICWRCLRTFGAASECYTHMSDVHGGHSTG